ncbi:MAG TPA: bifunctional (p)ppGpp synthetase/guanosine-3',5'-bis(diphosphate) 3'-pyrophosphohydrolase [Rhodanobacteraceae bacterium]|jgi:GTP pyrophosphokinase|nr:bifunctional (p)ppGpp synthetase/guanosine-3',5'-bis(diphosphate) 3'-pyrophosphohydrolase [Rhodanobacteraceae bacterium]
MHDQSPSLEHWLAGALDSAPREGTLARACALADARGEALGEAWISRRAQLLATLDAIRDLGVGAEALAAAILHALIEAGMKPDDAVFASFPEEVRHLVEGQQAAERVWSLYAARGNSGGTEGLRRLLLAIIRDLRVVFILLARQLVRMRRASQLPEDECRALAQLTADIHAPLANRLGIWQLKWELEDLAFRYLQPDVYRRIAELLDERRGDRESWIAEAKSTLDAALRKAGIDADIAGRPKHIHSIWRKMQKKGVEFSELYDVRALRLLVGDVATCYAALGVVHSLWAYIPGEFDDYIASPKGNQYQSLHTAVIGPGGKTLEVQIRTHEMHRHAELGFAAHWRYKEGGGADASFERKIAWMRQLLESKDAREDDAALLAGFRTEVIEDRVYLLTPKGQVIDLPRGATVLDFAYSIHTDVGHRCRGAKVNGRIVPLTFQPSSGDRVEILTGKTIEPRRDWLSPHHGYLATHRAREKVRTWFKRIDHAQNLAAGRALLDRELKRLALHQANIDALPARFQLKTQDELLEALALGDISPGQVARALHETIAPPSPSAPSAPPPRAPMRGKDAIVIEGVGNLMTQLAKCCQPLPGDAVAGFITRGRGVSVHRADCKQLARLRERDASRIIEVDWGERKEHAYEVNVVVRGYDRKWLHKDITNVIAAANAHLIAINTQVDAKQGLAEMNFALRVTDFGQLSGLLARLATVPNVLEARRVT